MRVCMLAGAEEEGADDGLPCPSFPLAVRCRSARAPFRTHLPLGSRRRAVLLRKFCLPGWSASASCSIHKSRHGGPRLARLLFAPRVPYPPRVRHSPLPAHERRVRVLCHVQLLTPCPALRLKRGGPGPTANRQALQENNETRGFLELGKPRPAVPSQAAATCECGPGVWSCMRGAAAQAVLQQPSDPPRPKCGTAPLAPATGQSQRGQLAGVHQTESNVSCANPRPSAGQPVHRCLKEVAAAAPGAHKHTDTGAGLAQERGSQHTVVCAGASSCPSGIKIALPSDSECALGLFGLRKFKQRVDAFDHRFDSHLDQERK
mmetsp:Transcript_51535/g.129297  ORF Transcript_51535/g.129297 Transcript_51535/m.129297 type:complete len:319 (+) Transcript_51535:119-1075(+)